MRPVEVPVAEQSREGTGVDAEVDLLSSASLTG
jgi:hypothetical protein